MPMEHLLLTKSFNPRPCARGDVQSDIVFYACFWFQSTPLREGRPTCTPGLFRLVLFQSTPLREGRRTAPFTSSLKTCFNPRPCARGDECEKAADHATEVSIHAPARGAT